MKEVQNIATLFLNLCYWVNISKVNLTHEIYNYSMYKKVQNNAILPMLFQCVAEVFLSKNELEKQCTFMCKYLLLIFVH